MIQNYYHYDGEQLGFYKKVISKHSARCCYNPYIARTKNSNSFDKNCTPENVKYHNQNDE